MEFSLIPYTKEAQALCKWQLERFGLTLTGEAMKALQAGRAAALRDTGRVELGHGILPQLVEAFCDAPDLTQENLTDELLLLQDIFYHWKSEVGDCVPDDEILALLRRAYDERARGRAEGLAGFTLREMKEVLRDE